MTKTAIISATVTLFFWLSFVVMARADCEIESIYVSDGVLSTTVRCVDGDGKTTWEIREVKSER